MEVFLNYDKEIGPGKLNVVGGYSFQRFNYKSLTVNGFGFADPNLGTMITNLRTSNDIIQNVIGGKEFQQYGLDGTTGTLFINQLFTNPPATTQLGGAPVTPVKSVTGDTQDHYDALQSFFARANYSIGDKYILTSTIRTDGSSKFGPNNKYGIFPSAALAWKLINESFIKDLKVFDDLKLRIGYGVTGNQAIPHNLFQLRERFGAITIGNGGAVQTTPLTFVATERNDLKWESTAQGNIGLDFAFFKAKLKGSVDLYQKRTDNLLLQSVAAQPSPFPFVTQNIPAKVYNRGVEVVLNYYAIDTEKAGLNFSFNGALNDNIVLNIPNNATFQTGGINGQGLSNAFAEQIGNHQALFAYYLRPFLGYDAAGNSIYKIDQQLYNGASPLPRYNLGFTINARCKGWDFSAIFNAQTGQYVYNNTANALFTAGSLKNGRNVTDNVVYSGESPVNAPDVSTRFLERGDFLRFQNLNIGHNFKMAEGSKFKKIRLGISGQNLFVITPYSGRDPEVNINHTYNNLPYPSAGIDYTSYPRAKTYTISLNAIF